MSSKSIWKQVWKSDPAPAPFFWHPKGTSTEEKRFLFKIDFFILTFGCLTYWVKYLDSANLSNAYVTGMSDELGWEGNDLSTANAVFWAGQAISQIPSNIILTKVPARYWLPGMEFIWGVLTLAMYKAQSPTTIIVLRFFIGFFEGANFVGMSYIIGSWYKRHELGKRFAIFACAAYAGSMFSGYIMSAIHATMEGKNGLSGWRWLFIIDAIITFAVAIWGFIFFPDTPWTTKAFYLTEAEKERARQRMVEDGRDIRTNELSWSMFPRVLKSPYFWLLVPLWMGWNESVGKFIGTVFPLYLKELNLEGKMSIYTVNNLPTTSSGVNIFGMIVIAWIIDLTGQRMIVIMSCFALQILGTILLLAWDIPYGLKIFSFIAAAFDGPTSPAIQAWANTLIGATGDAQVRAITLAVMNSLAFVLATIASQFVYQTQWAPRFTVGYSWSLAWLFVMIGLVLIVRYVEVSLRANIPPELDEAQAQGTIKAGSFSADDDLADEKEANAQVKAAIVAP